MTGFCHLGWRFFFGSSDACFDTSGGPGRAGPGGGDQPVVVVVVVVVIFLLHSDKRTRETGEEQAQEILTSASLECFLESSLLSCSSFFCRILFHLAIVCRLIPVACVLMLPGESYAISYLRLLFSRGFKLSFHVFRVLVPHSIRVQVFLDCERVRESSVFRTPPGSTYSG